MHNYNFRLSRSSAKDPRDLRDYRDPRDLRDPRDYGNLRDPRDPRGLVDTRDPRDPRGLVDTRDSRDPRNIQDLRGPREVHNPPTRYGESSAVDLKAYLDTHKGSKSLRLADMSFGDEGAELLKDFLEKNRQVETL